MRKQIGYIYLRSHPSYGVNNALKIGKSINIPERDTQYATSEIKRGHFQAVFEVPIKKMGIVEHRLQSKFCELNVRYDGGTEFYNKKITTLIEPYSYKLGIEHKKLFRQGIRGLTRFYEINKTNKNSQSWKDKRKLKKLLYHLIVLKL